jgi:hypothetical protein
MLGAVWRAADVMLEDEIVRMRLEPMLQPVGEQR